MCVLAAVLCLRHARECNSCHRRAAAWQVSGAASIGRAHKLACQCISDLRVSAPVLAQWTIALRTISQCRCLVQGSRVSRLHSSCAFDIHTTIHVMRYMLLVVLYGYLQAELLTDVP